MTYVSLKPYMSLKAAFEFRDFDNATPESREKIRQDQERKAAAVDRQAILYVTGKELPKMKRNKEKARNMRSGTSPYAKYGKTPYRYSPAIMAWEREHGRKIRAEQQEERNEKGI